MRDYRSITADAFLVEGINHKLKWLARRLQKLDDETKIEKWVQQLELL